MDHLGLHRFGNRSVVELQDVYTAVGKVRRDFVQKYLQQKKVKAGCQIYWSHLLKMKTRDVPAENQDQRLINYRNNPTEKPSCEFLCHGLGALPSDALGVPR